MLVSCLQGRILVFSGKGGKLTLVCEKEVKGAAYNVNPFQVGLLQNTNITALQLAPAASHTRWNYHILAEARFCW